MIKSFCFSLLMLPLCLVPAVSLADTFSLSVPAGAEVVMADPQAIVPVTVTNAGPSRDIRSITFNANTSNYSFSAAAVPPNGWCVDSFSTDAIRFALVQDNGSCGTGSQPAEISPGEKLTFNITVIPTPAANDLADTFTSVNVNAQSNLNRTGPMPAWTRRSLEAELEASPSSVGTGDTVTLVMRATNRSTSAKTLIGSSPSPPSSSPPLATNTEGPYYAATLLTAPLTASATSVNVSSTADFPSSGTLRTDGEEICYSGKTAASLTGVTRGCNSTAAAAHSSGAIVFGKDQFSINPGQTKSIVWKYAADSTGTVSFGARASNGSGTARSPAVSSNGVVIGGFTASLALDPAGVVTGQDIMVEMNVANNGAGALINVTPSALTPCAGGAAETFVSGPLPALIPSLAPGSSGVFVWTYRITGSVGQAYCLSGSARANGPVTTNTAASNAGVISAYSATVAPSAVSSGSTGVTLTWTVRNQGGCGIRGVDIDIPSSWNCSSTSAPSGWSGSCGGVVDFSSSRRNYDIDPGQTGLFSITFSSVETVTADKTASFPIALTPRGCGGGSTTLGSYVTVSADRIAMSHSPAGPVYADGSSFYTITATLTSGGSPQAGKIITFASTNGSLNASSALTDASGQAAVTLTAPVSTTNASATVTAVYGSAEKSEAVSFTGWTGANIQYWGNLDPAAIACGSKYTFKMKVRNLSTTADMNLTKSSYFAFNDSAFGGTAEFRAYLDNPVTIIRNTEQEIEFGSATSSATGGGVQVPSSFVAGAYTPIINPAPPPSSGLYLTNGSAGQWRSVTDGINVSGICGATRVRVIDWHEMW